MHFIALWYSFGDWLGQVIGFDLSASEPVIGLGHFITPDFLWFDTYYLLGTLGFYFFGVVIRRMFGNVGPFWVRPC